MISLRVGMMMLAAVCACAVPMAVFAGGDDSLDAVSGDLAARFHLHTEHVPMMWMASSVARVYTHGGVSHLRMRMLSDGNVSSEELNHQLNAELGPTWSRMVHSHEHDGEDSFVYVRPAANDRMEMMVINSERGEMQLIDMQVDGKRLADAMENERDGHSVAD